MARFVLIHGAWSRGAMWNAVAGHLRAMGHEVAAPDLPGHGDDPTPPDQVGLEACATAVAELVRAGPAPVLVGHSMGGMVISAVAERVPEALQRLVYVAALLPADGQSLLDLIRGQDIPGVQDMVRRAPQPGATVLAPEGLCKVLCQDADARACAAVLAGLGHQPNRVQTDPVRLSPGRFGTVARSYVLCRDDRTVSPALQRAMLARTPCDPVHELDAGHLPQVTRAADLAALIAAQT